MNTPSSCPFSTARISIAFEPQPITCESPIRARERGRERRKKKTGKGERRGEKEERWERRGEKGSSI